MRVSNTWQPVKPSPLQLRFNSKPSSFSFAASPTRTLLQLTSHSVTCRPTSRLNHSQANTNHQAPSGEVLISYALAIEPVGGWTTESVTHGQCEARPTVPSQPKSVTTLWPVPNYTAWWTEAHVCEQLAQGCYLAVPWLGVEPATTGLQVRHITVTLPSHTASQTSLIHN